MSHDPVNHPKHYTEHPSGIECITITRHMGFNLGNAMKYIWRASFKNGIEDLQKAAWYINDEIERLKCLGQKELYSPEGEKILVRGALGQETHNQEDCATTT